LWYARTANGDRGREWSRPVRLRDRGPRCPRSPRYCLASTAQVCRNMIEGRFEVSLRDGSDIHRPFGQSWRRKARMSRWEEGALSRSSLIRARDLSEHVRESVLADRALRILVHAQLEHVGTRVVADNVEVVLPP
jgi:hypothetical protein